MVPRQPQVGALAIDEDANCAGCGLAIKGGTAAFQTLPEGLTARDFTDIAYGRLHRMVVDIYAVQHPERYGASAKSLTTHLGGLCLILEHAGDRAMGSDHFRRWLERAHLEKPVLPDTRGALTIADVLAARQCSAIVRACGKGLGLRCVARLCASPQDCHGLGGTGLGQQTRRPTTEEVTRETWVLRCGCRASPACLAFTDLDASLGFENRLSPAKAKESVPSMSISTTTVLSILTSASMGSPGRSFFRSAGTSSPEWEMTGSDTLKRIRGVTARRQVHFAQRLLRPDDRVEIDSCRAFRPPSASPPCP